MNRRGFAGAALVCVGGLFFPQKLKAKESSGVGLTHVEMTTRVFMHDNQVVCVCLPFPRNLIPSPSSTANVFGDDTILHVRSRWGMKDYFIDIADPDNKIIQFNRASKKPIHYVRQNDRWTKL